MSDVAKLAGVSPTTVSLVINDVANANISSETRMRVKDAIRKLSYRRNSAAKALRTNQTHTIGFLTDEVATSPFAGEIIRGSQEKAWSNNKVLLIVSAGDNTSMKKAAVEVMLDRQVEAVIYAAVNHKIINPPSNLYEIPSVLVDCSCPDRSLPSFVPDEVKGGRNATEALLSKGHRRIGFINIRTVVEEPAGIGRLKGYKQALQAFGVEFDPTLVREGNSLANDGYLYALELLQLPQPPTALFCATDRMAMGAYDAIREQGLRIPQDIAVVGFDNQEIISAFLRPALTTVQLPHYQMGQLAVEYLLNSSSGEREGEQPPQYIIDCPFIERDSI